MKKICLIIFMVLIVTALLISCKTPPESTAETPVDSPALTEATPTSQPTTLDATDSFEFGDVKFIRSGDVLTVSLSNEELPNQEVSVLVLTDEKHLENWQETDGALINIGQISLDEKGSGSVTLNVSGDNNDFVIYVFGQNGQYIKEAGANVEKN